MYARLSLQYCFNHGGSLMNIMYHVIVVDKFGHDQTVTKGGTLKLAKKLKIVKTY
jgi:hypothetical protein